MNTRRFEGKTALVTGGASGIGDACVLSFAREGANVVIADWNRESGEGALARVKKTGGKAVFVHVDVGDPKSVERMVSETVGTFGRLDIAVNNAGISGESAPTGEYSIDGWRKVIDVNFNGVFYCMRYEIPHMLAQGAGTIVNMASILGMVGFEKAPAYVAAKHGIIGLTRTAALEYAGQGLRINAVGPGFIKTPLVSDALDEETLQHLAGLHALGRMGESEEVAALVAFLCSDEASFMTGGYHVVDGGYTAR